VDRVDNRTGFFHTIDGVTREICVELPDERLVDSLRAMTPEQRLGSAAKKAAYFRKLLQSQLESLHPEWTPDRVRAEIARRRRGT
jgi:hypothetical protein